MGARGENPERVDAGLERVLHQRVSSLKKTPPQGFTSLEETPPQKFTSLKKNPKSFAPPQKLAKSLNERLTKNLEGLTKQLKNRRMKRYGESVAVITVGRKT